jgi:hypothetical protein
MGDWVEVHRSWLAAVEADPGLLDVVGRALSDIDNAVVPDDVIPADEAIRRVQAAAE